MNTINTSDTHHIPKIIHQIWTGPPEPEFIQEARLTVQELNPEFEYMFWNEDTLTKNGFSIPEGITEAFKGDILKLNLLTSFGGVYIDADYICREPILELIQRYTGLASVQVNRYPDCGFIIAPKGIDFTEALVDYLPIEPISFYWRRMRPELIPEEDIGVQGKYLHDLKLNSWVKEYKSSMKREQKTIKEAQKRKRT